MMQSLKSRLSKHFAACTAVAAVASVGTMATPSAEAAITYSGPVNIVIPNNIDGIYMNIVTGATGSSGGAVAGWDINPYSATAGNFNLWGPTVTTWLNIGGNYALPFGTMIDGAGTYARPGGGTNIGTQVTLNSDQNFLGFQFANEANANQIHFGWIQVAFGATAGDRAIVGYAYEDVAGAGIGAGIIPAPGSLALLGLGALGVAGRRRK